MVLYDLRSLSAYKNIHLSDAEHPDNSIYLYFSYVCRNDDKVTRVFLSVDQVTIKTRKKNVYLLLLNNA